MYILISGLLNYTEASRDHTFSIFYILQSTGHKAGPTVDAD